MPPNNPYAKPKPAAAPVSPKKTKPRYGEAQAEFIRRTRQAIKEDPTILNGVDWRRISYSKSCLSLTGKKKTSVNDFYVKDLAVWLPHAIIPHCVPTCFRCESKDGVDVTRFRWTKLPKILYGTHTHRYLDTAWYTCVACSNQGNGEFAAWNEKTLLLDSKEITGILNFRLSNGFAVDEDLYSFLISHAIDTTAGTHERLNDHHANHWVNLATMYHRAILAKRIKPIEKKGPMDQMFSLAIPETRAQRRRKSLQWEHTQLERKVQGAQSSFDTDVDFSNISRRKENRNSIGEIFPGIGKAKCDTLVRYGIRTARALLAYEGDSPSIKPEAF